MDDKSNLNLDTDLEGLFSAEEGVSSPESSSLDGLFGDEPVPTDEVGMGGSLFDNPVADPFSSPASPSPVVDDFVVDPKRPINDIITRPMAKQKFFAGVFSPHSSKKIG